MPVCHSQKSTIELNNTDRLYQWYIVSVRFDHSMKLTILYIHKTFPFNLIMHLSSYLTSANSHYFTDSIHFFFNAFPTLIPLIKSLLTILNTNLFLYFPFLHTIQTPNSFVPYFYNSSHTLHAPQPTYQKKKHARTHARTHNLNLV